MDGSNQGLVLHEDYSSMQVNSGCQRKGTLASEILTPKLHLWNALGKVGLDGTCGSLQAPCGSLHEQSTGAACHLVDQTHLLFQCDRLPQALYVKNLKSFRITWGLGWNADSISAGPGGTWDSAFLTSSQVTLMLLVHRSLRATSVYNFSSVNTPKWNSEAREATQ